MKEAASSKVFRAGLVLLAAVVLVAGAAPLDATERNRGGDTRSSSASSSSPPPRASSSGSGSGSGSGARVTRSHDPSSGGTAYRGSRSRTPNYGHGSRHHYGYYGGYWGRWGVGYYPWGYYYGHYYPYYPVFPTVYYGPYPGGYRDYRLGAVDLNVKPKKTEVWVDGQLVGPVGKFDGFPGYLWLGRGRHQLIFHKPGFKTEVREIRVLEGTVVRLRLLLEPGETIPPEQLAAVPASRRRLSAEREAGKPGRGSGSAHEEANLRSEPGRLRLSIEPGDASVYLDGRFLGTGSELSRLHAGLLVEQGEHTLEVVRPGYDSESVDLLVDAEAETDLSIELEPE